MPAQAVNPATCTSTTYNSGTNQCTLPAGASIAYVIKGGNGGAGGNGGHGGTGGSYYPGTYTGGFGGIQGVGAIGGAGAKVSGTYTNTSGTDEVLTLEVGLNGVPGTAGSNGTPGTNGTSGTPQGQNGQAGGVALAATNGTDGMPTTIMVSITSIAAAEEGLGGTAGTGGNGGLAATISSNGVSGQDGINGTPGAAGTGGNMSTTWTEAPFIQITLVVPSSSTGDASPAAPAALSIDPGAGTCGTLVLDSYVGHWVILPGANDCRLPSRPGAVLLGWSTSSQFPVSIAQRQSDRAWGAYEIRDAAGELTSVFIPAGHGTFVSGPNTVYPIWSA